MKVKNKMMPEAGESIIYWDNGIKTGSIIEVNGILKLFNGYTTCGKLKTGLAWAYQEDIIISE